MLRNIIDRVKLTFKKDRELASSLYKILGFYPHNLDFYRMALAHKSQGYRNPKFRASNNERLEFLGDAILEAVVSDIVFHRYDSKREGFLTNTRSKIVQRSSLNKLSSEIGLNRLIRTAGLSHTHNNNIGGNAFEALVGAIYLDRGYTQCQKFIEKRIIGAKLDIDSVAKKEVNFKSKLLEWTQKNRLICDYTFDVHEDNDAHSPVFNSTVVIEGVTVGRGQGYSKKESQQFAAKGALKQMRRDPELADSVYRGKEKRTAMEADEVCALPKIDEIEAEIAREKAATKTTKPSAPTSNARPQDRNRNRNKSQEKKEQPKEKKEQQAQKEQPQQKKEQQAQKPQRTSRNARRAPGKAEVPAEALPQAPAEAPAEAPLKAPAEVPAEAPAVPRVETIEKIETIDKLETPAPAEPKQSEQPAPAEAEPKPKAKSRSRRKPKAKPQEATESASQENAAQEDAAQEDAAQESTSKEEPAQKKSTRKRSPKRKPAQEKSAQEKPAQDTPATNPEETSAPARPRRRNRRKPATSEQPAAEKSSNAEQPSAAEREDIIARAEASAFEADE